MWPEAENTKTLLRYLCDAFISEKTLKGSVVKNHELCSIFPNLLSCYYLHRCSITSVSSPFPIKTRKWLIFYFSDITRQWSMSLDLSWRLINLCCLAGEAKFNYFGSECKSFKKRKKVTIRFKFSLQLIKKNKK